VVISAKTAERIKMSFGLWAWMDPKNYLLDGSQQVLMEVAMATNFGAQLAFWLLMGYKLWLYDS